MSDHSIGSVAYWRAGWLDFRRKRFWAWVLLATYALVGFAIVPWLARGIIVDAVHDATGATATLDDVDVNPFALSTTLSKFALADRAGTQLVSFDKLYVNFELSSLFRRAFTFSEVLIENPFVDLVREPDGGINLAKLIAAPKNQKKEEAAPKRDSAPVRLLITRTEIKGGRAKFRDDSAPEPYQTQFGPINVVVTDLNTLPDQAGRQQISIVGERGAKLTWTGTIEINPLRSAGHIALETMPLDRFTAYVPPDVGAAITGGTLGFAFDYAVARKGTEYTADVDKASLAIDALKIATNDPTTPRDLIEVPALRVSDAHFRWPEQRVEIADVNIDGPAVWLWRAADGRLNVETIVAAKPAAPNTAGTAASEAAPTASPSPASKWQIALAHFGIARGAVHFSDASLTPAAPLDLNDVALGLDRFTLDDNAQMPFTLALSVGSGGTVSATGDLTVLPATIVHANAQVRDLALIAAEPYLAAQSVLSLRSGTVTLDGNIASAPDEPLAYDGKVSVADFAMIRSDTGDRMAEWKRLDAEGVAVRLGKSRADIANATLDHAYARLHIGKDGTLNLVHLIKGETPAAAGGQPPAPESSGAAKSSAPPWAVKIGRFKLGDSEIDYRDDSLPIPFVTAISEFDGKLATLDTTSKRPADIDFEGKVGEFGSVRVDGSLQPLDVARNTAFTARFQNIDMRDASPYSIRFAGHTIASGKLDLDTHYQVHAGQLTAAHQIVIRDFELGEKVDYPDALDLPFGLAISLLKSPDGVIRVDLPIEGNVDDPQFRLGGVIRAALVNLLTKIVTSPFRLLGGLLGLGDEAQLDSLAFRPGRADLGPPERETIGKLAQALTMRPQLLLIVPAVAAEAEDSRALRENAVKARIDAASAGADQSGIRKIVEKMAEPSIGKDERAAIEAKHTIATPPSTKPQLDEVAYIGALTDRLIELEPLEPGAVAMLAAARRAAVVDAVRGEPGIAPERVVEAEQETAKAEHGDVVMKFKINVAKGKNGPAQAAPQTEPAATGEAAAPASDAVPPVPPG